MKIEIAKVISDLHIQNQIWQIYSASFQGSEFHCAQNQKCYDEESFKKALMDPEYYKYYSEVDGRIAAYMLCTNNLQKASITYMNPEKYLATFPEYAPDRIYYFTSLAVSPDSRSQRAFYKLIETGLQHINSLNAMFAFDFSHETVFNLAHVFVKISENLRKKGLMPEIEYKKVGAQEFGALVPKKTS